NVHLVNEERKAESIRVCVVERHKTVVRGKNLLQRLMDAREQLIQVRGFIQRVHNFGVDLALGFHPVKVGNVPEMNQQCVGSSLAAPVRSEEHTSDISYAVFCLKKKLQHTW